MPSLAIVNLYGDTPNTALTGLSAHAEANRFDVSIFDAIDGNFPRPRRFDRYIITGGHGMPNASSPWRVRVQAAIPDWAKSRPVFGIGLGFQLMAAAYGWPVRPIANKREGVFSITPTPGGWDDSIMKDVTAATPVMENREWGVLPPPAAPRSGAMVLAYSSAGDVAAARFTKHAAGAIFHPEARIDGAASTIIARFFLTNGEPS